MYDSKTAKYFKLLSELLRSDPNPSIAYNTVCIVMHNYFRSSSNLK